MTDPARRMPALALAFALALAAPGAGAAETGTDLVFQPGQLTDVATGRTLAYAHDRVAPGDARDAELSGGRITVSLETPEQGRAAILRMEGNGRERRLDPFPGGDEAGNPVLLVFLESVSRRISEVTGGNLFYIRNRIKDAFREGGAVETRGNGARRVSYRPFTEDPNQEELGDFADLTIAFVIGQDAPGHFLSLSAHTGGEAPSYREEIRLMDAGMGENE